MKSTRDILITFFTKLIMLPLTIIVSIIVRRMLGPDGAGIYAFTVLMISLGTSIGSIGFGAGIQYYIASNKYKHHEVIFSSLFVSLVLSIIYGCLFAVLYHFKLLPPEANHLLVILSIIFALFPSFVIFYTMRHFMALSAFTLLSGWQVLQAVLPISILLISVIFQLGLVGILVSIPINFNILMLIAVLILHRRGWQWKINFPFIRDCFTYGLQAWIGDLALRANLRADQIIISITQPIAQLGFYAIAVQLTELIWYLADSVGQVLQPRIAAMNNQDAITLTNQVWRIVSLLTLLIVIILFFTAEQLIRLTYGEEFSETRFAVYALLPGALGYLGAKMFSKYLSARKSPGKVSTAQIAGAGVSFPLYILLIPSYGVVGAGIASSIGYTVSSLLMWHFYRKETKTPLSALLPHFQADWAFLIIHIASLRSRLRPVN